MVDIQLKGLRFRVCRVFSLGLRVSRFLGAGRFSAQRLGFKV